MKDKEPNLKQSIKKASGVIFVFMVLNMLRKLVFQFHQTVSLFNDFYVADNKVFLILVMLLTAFIIWALLSIVVGSFYYLITKINLKRIRD